MAFLVGKLPVHGAVLEALNAAVAHITIETALILQM